MASEGIFMSLKTRLSVLLLSTPVLAFVLVGGLMGQSTTASGDERFAHIKVFQDVLNLVMDNYVVEVKPDRVMEGAMRGLADGLDPDNAYLTPALVRSVESGEALPDGDVGLNLTRQYYLRVVATRDGSPAAKAGLQTGDYIRAIDGKPTRDMSVFEGNRLLRGKPGSKLTLTVIRGNAADPHEVPLVREKFSGPLVTSRSLGTGIGYMRIVAFNDGIAAELRRQASELAAGGAKTLIVDVRRTADGTYENGLAAARLFVKSGTLAIKAGREKEPREQIQAAAGDGAITLPVMLLTTTGTSGPAELFVSALDGTNRAEVIGERTLGRAGIQKLVKLPEGRGIWLTYARYLRPDGSAIQGRGIEPDVAVDEPSPEFGSPAPDKDTILDAALERARAKAAA
jgi:carboxyl-terminal processing protease